MRTADRLRRDRQRERDVAVDDLLDHRGVVLAELELAAAAGRVVDEDQRARDVAAERLALDVRRAAADGEREVVGLAEQILADDRRDRDRGRPGVSAGRRDVERVLDLRFDRSLEWHRVPPFPSRESATVTRRPGFWLALPAAIALAACGGDGGMPQDAALDANRDAVAMPDAEPDAPPGSGHKVGGSVLGLRALTTLHLDS